MSGKIQKTWKFSTHIYLRNKNVGFPISQKLLTEEKKKKQCIGKEKDSVQLAVHNHKFCTWIQPTWIKLDSWIWGCGTHGYRKPTVVWHLPKRLEHPGILVSLGSWNQSPRHTLGELPALALWLMEISLYSFYPYFLACLFIPLLYFSTLPLTLPGWSLSMIQVTPIKLCSVGTELFCWQHSPKLIHIGVLAMIIYQ